MYDKMEPKTVIWNDQPLLPFWDETLALALSHDICPDMPQTGDHYLYHRDEYSDHDGHYYAPRDLLAVGYEEPAGNGFGLPQWRWLLVCRTSQEKVMGIRVTDDALMPLEFASLPLVRQFVERITGLIVDYDEPTEAEQDAYLCCVGFSRRWRFF